MSFNNQYWHLQRAGGEALILKTTKSGTFSMTITTSSTVDVDWGDGNSDAGVSGVITHSYADSSEKTISVTNDLDLITSFNCEFNNLNPIDLSSLVSCTFFAIGSNSNLSEIINPTSSAIITTYNAASCNLNSLDVSGFSNLGGVFSVFGNSNLSSILFPASSRDFSLLYAYLCNLTSIDLSPLSGNIANLNLSNNNLTSIDLGALTVATLNLKNNLFTSIDLSNRTFTAIDIESNNLTSINLTNADTNSIKLEFNNLNSIDLSSLVSCTFFELGANSNLSEIINPASSAIITTYNAVLCNLNSLDVSGFSNLGGVFSVFGNSNLSSILFPASSRDFSLLYAYSCNLASIDLSPLSGNVANLSLHSNSNLSTITLCADITNILLYSCDLGVVDFSGTTYNSIRVENNNMTAAEVNETLVNLDTQGLTSKNLNISGTNAAPDGTSGGFDGLTAKTNLQGKGWTVTTS